MMDRFANPTLRMIGGLFAGAVAVLVLAAWMIYFGGPRVSAYAFPPLLIGLILLFIATSLLALWALNRAQDPKSPTR